MNKLEKSFRALIYRVFPSLFWRPYVAKARAVGIDKQYLILSFDCDADEDIPAAQKIHDWLGERGYHGVFAVPGVQMEKGKKVFQQMAKEGAIFINHGGAAHTEWRDGRYWSVNFYDQISLEEVEADIRLGHDIVSDVIGIAPTGFRAPHFGHFQRPKHLVWLYDLLQEMGYRYASTTTPAYADKLGPVGVFDDFFEFPTSGTYQWPLRIFDSWGHLINYETFLLQEDYYEAISKTLIELKKKSFPSIMNYYVDPAHVVANDVYFKSIEFALQHNAVLTNYPELIAEVL